MSNVYALRDGAAGGEHRSIGRWARPTLVTLVLFSALFLAGRFLAMPLMTIRHVVVHSDVRLSEEQVLALSGIQGGEPWYSVNVLAIQQRLEAVPLIRAATVERLFPDTPVALDAHRMPSGMVGEGAPSKSSSGTIRAPF